MWSITWLRGNTVQKYQGVNYMVLNHQLLYRLGVANQKMFQKILSKNLDD